MKYNCLYPLDLNSSNLNVNVLVSSSYFPSATSTDVIPSSRYPINADFTNVNSSGITVEISTFFCSFLTKFSTPIEYLISSPAFLTSNSASISDLLFTVIENCAWTISDILPTLLNVVPKSFAVTVTFDSIFLNWSSLIFSISSSPVSSFLWIITYSLSMLVKPSTPL